MPLKPRMNTNGHEWDWEFSVVGETRQIAFRRVFESGATRDAAFGLIGVDSCPFVVERLFYG